MSTWGNIAKTASTWGNIAKSGMLTYLLREEGGYLLKEDGGKIILTFAITWTNLTKN